MRVLERLDTLGFSRFKGLIDIIMPKKERRQSKIIISYIRIHTQLNNAFNMLSKDRCRHAFEYLSLAKKFIRQLKFEEEKLYLNRILKILNELLKNKERIIAGIRKEEASDPFHIKTFLLLAQNICILRILKINKD
ncbi:hypothetical protein HYX08_03085 [Candidatus Woesearchaeota archaeon]|nr:hypothetical protein [Candidatus Woesearchaeota archaeon]